METKIKRKRIYTFHQFVKYLVTFGFDNNKPFIGINVFVEDFFRSMNPKDKPKLDKKLRNYFHLATSGNLITLNLHPKNYSELVILTEFGARYLLNVNDHIKSSLLSGVVGAVASAILTAVLAFLFRTTPDTTQTASLFYIVQSFLI